MSDDFEIIIQNDTGRAVIDRTILSQALKMYFWGIPKKRICELKLQDVYVSGKIVDKIDLGKGKFSDSLDDQSKTILLSYVTYLQSNYPIKSDSPLFPNYHGSSGHKNLARHMKQFTNFRDFHQLRKSVEESFVDKLEKSGISREESVKAASNHFKRTTRGIKGTQPKARTGSDDVSRMLRVLDEIVVWDEIDILSSRDKFGVQARKFFQIVDLMKEDEKKNLALKQVFLNNAAKRILEVTSPYKTDEIPFNYIKNNPDIEQSWSMLLNYIDEVKKSLKPEQKKKFEITIRRQDKLASTSKYDVIDGENGNIVKTPREVMSKSDHENTPKCLSTRKVVRKEIDDISEKIRVYELSKELGVKNEQIVDHLQSIGVLVRSATSLVDVSIANKIRETLKKVRAEKRAARALRLKKTRVPLKRESDSIDEEH